MSKHRLRTLQLIDIYIRGYISQQAFDLLILANRQQFNIVASRTQ